MPRMPPQNHIDLHIGKRLKHRRTVFGYTMVQLADVVGMRFQQIQKYECAANRITVSRLYQLAEALHVPPGYFYEGLNLHPAPNEAFINVTDLSHEHRAHVQSIVNVLKAAKQCPPLPQSEPQSKPLSSVTRD